MVDMKVSMGIFGAWWVEVGAVGKLAGTHRVPSANSSSRGILPASSSVLLTGCYRRALDDKSRLAIPKQLRDVLGFPQETSLFIAPGTDRALEIYSAAVLEQIGQSLSKLSQAAKDTRAFSRLFYAQAQPAEVDKQGRLRVPPELASLAGIKNEVVVLGVRDRIELWEPTQWEQFLAQNQSSYDQLAESVLGQAAQTECSIQKTSTE